MTRDKKLIDSRLEEYIRSYQELLEEKGYTEPSLNSGTAPGTLAANIDKGFRAIVDLPEGNSSGQGVMIQTFGRFGEHNESIRFDFVFAYNHQSGTISLELMRVADEMVEMTCVPKLASLIPDLQTALVLFRKECIRLLPQQVKQSAKRPNGRRL